MGKCCPKACVAVFLFFLLNDCSSNMVAEHAPFTVKLPVRHRDTFSVGSDSLVLISHRDPPMQRLSLILHLQLRPQLWYPAEQTPFSGRNQVFSSVLFRFIPPDNYDDCGVWKKKGHQTSKLHLMHRWCNRYRGVDENL